MSTFGLRLPRDTPLCNTYKQKKVEKNTKMKKTKEEKMMKKEEEEVEEEERNETEGPG